jgi:hypothetical protein
MKSNQIFNDCIEIKFILFCLSFQYSQDKRFRISEHASKPNSLEMLKVCFSEVIQ